MRIVSLVPSVTEILFAIGIGPDVVGRTHECDYPPEAASIPVVTSDLIAHMLPSAAIDAVVAGAVSDVHSMYRLDADALTAQAPDLVVTQRLCGVCAVPRRDVDEVVCSMPAKVLDSDPRRLDDVWDSVLSIAEMTGADAAGEALVGSIRRRLRRVARATAGFARPRVAVIEWPDPLYAPGYWVPEMVEAAGGISVLGTAGEPSRRAEFDELADARPDIVVLAFCGFRLKETQVLLRELAGDPRWSEVAMRARIVAVDGSSTYSRPGTRLVDGIELLAWAIHRPDVFLKPGPGQAAELIEAGWIDITALPVQQHQPAD